jgi:hypothetical protein
MNTPVLDAMAESLRDFRPRTQREFVLLQIAKKFNDDDLLAKYLKSGGQYPKKVLLEAARLAQQQAEASGREPSALFFEVLERFDKEKSP